MSLSFTADPDKREIRCPNCEQTNTLSLCRRRNSYGKNILDFVSTVCWNCRKNFPVHILTQILSEFNTMLQLHASR